jgi:transcriptional regulator with XRE-family HTH domain
MRQMRRFWVKGQPDAATPYHYRGCGLDDIYLTSGFEIEETEYGPAVTIVDVPGLHRAIGKQLITDSKALSPREFRFLRKNMDFTQEALAGLLRLDAQTIARYEKDQCAIPGPVDGMIRMMFALHVMPKKQREQVFEDIKAILEDEPSEPPSRGRSDFAHDPSKGWGQRQLAH